MVKSISMVKTNPNQSGIFHLVSCRRSWLTFFCKFLKTTEFFMAIFPAIKLRIPTFDSRNRWPAKNIPPLKIEADRIAGHRAKSGVAGKPRGFGFSYGRQRATDTTKILRVTNPIGQYSSRGCVVIHNGHSYFTGLILVRIPLESLPSVFITPHLQRHIKSSTDNGYSIKSGQRRPVLTR